MSAFPDNLRYLRKRENLTQAELAKSLGVKGSTIGMYEQGRREPDFETQEAIADYFNVDMNFLMGRNPSNIFPMPRMKRVPRIGSIACGEPVLAEQNIECYDSVPEFVDADFTLTCKGDSMINARIFDGDLVCIREQPMVENDEIAAVLIGSEATLKRVKLYADHISLEPENPMYKPIVYWNEEMNDVKIVGKATHFISTVR